MRKINIIIVATVLFLNSLLSAGPSPQPENVYRFIYVQKSYEWYVEQAKLWKKEAEKRPNDPTVWYNYFMATKYSLWRGDLSTYKHKMDSILNEMSAKIPDSYEYNYLRFYNGERDVKLLERAYKRDPKRADALYELVMYYETQGDEENLKKFCSELYHSMDISTGLLNYNYNVLASTEKNGILFTNGDNDTYPVWVLQHALNIRKDVTVLNLHLIFNNREYLKRKLAIRESDNDVDLMSKENMSVFIDKLLDKITNEYPQRPIHVALTVYKNIVRNIEEKLYLVGLTFKYSTKRFDNIERIKNNIYNNLRLDYLDYDWYSEQYLVTSLLDNLHMNYVVVYLKLAESLHKSGNSAEAARWKSHALKLAKKAENEEFIGLVNELEW
jgi:hypothetical protein